MELFPFEKLIKGNVYYIDLTKDFGYKFRHRAKFEKYKSENTIKNNTAEFSNIIQFKMGQLFSGWHDKAFWNFYKPTLFK